MKKVKANMQWTIGKKIIIGLALIVVILSAIQSVVGYRSMKSSLIESAQQKLISDLKLGFEFINEKYPGDWQLKDGQLYKGDVKINENYEIVDSIGDLTGGNTVTIFLNDTRVTTNVIDENGQRAVGTKVSDEVKKVVLEGKERYVGRANVVGQWNQTAYEPIYDKDGQVIGIWYTGVPEEPFIDIAQKATIQNIIITLIVAIITFAISFWFSNKKISRPLSKMRLRAEEISNLDLTGKSIGFKGTDDIGVLGNSIDKMKEHLVEVVQKLNESALQVASASDQLAISSRETESATNQVVAAIQEITSGTTKQAEFADEIVLMTEKSVQVVEEGLQQATNTLNISKESTETAYNGSKTITEAVSNLKQVSDTINSITNSVQKLGKRSEEIGGIITTITAVADQTNLLALNASIESARAGEAGKGFAVVAEEIRKLAEESKVSADQITQLIKDIQSETRQTIVEMETGFSSVIEQIKMVEEGGKSLTDIVEKTEETEKNTIRLNEVFKQLENNLQNVHSAIYEISSVIDQTADLAEEVSSATEEQVATINELALNAQSLDNLASDLEEQVKKFKVKEE